MFIVSVEMEVWLCEANIYFHFKSCCFVYVQWTGVQWQSRAAQLAKDRPEARRRTRAAQPSGLGQCALQSEGEVSTLEGEMSHGNTD